MIPLEHLIKQSKEFVDAAEESAVSGNHALAIGQYHAALRILCKPEHREQLLASKEAQELMTAGMNKLLELDTGSFSELRKQFSDYLAA